MYLHALDADGKWVAVRLSDLGGEGEASLSRGAGAVDANTQRITHAHGTVTTLLSAVTGTGAGSSVQPAAEKMTVQVLGTTSSGAGATSVNIEVCNDNTRWLLAGTVSLTLSTTAATDGFVIDAPWKYLRANVASISGTGAAVTATVAV